MSDKVIEMVTAKQEADELHRQIMAAGNMATIAIVEMARCLKRMRDGSLYKERGFASFDEYVENDVGIGTRHAYNYIHVYEQFGDTALQSNAHLGITKLELLARLPIAERQELLEDPNTGSESVAKLKEHIAELQKKGEQMTLLVEENDRLKAKLEDAAAEATAELNERIEALESEKAALREDLDDAERRWSEAEERVAKAKASLKKAKENPKIPDSMLAKIKQEESDRARKEAKEALAAELQKAVEEAAQAKAERDSIKNTADEAARRLEEAERKLKTAAPEVAAFKTMFDNVQMLCGRMKETIRALRDTDTSTAEKLIKALCAFADTLKEGC